MKEPFRDRRVSRLPNRGRIQIGGDTTSREVEWEVPLKEECSEQEEQRKCCGTARQDGTLAKSPSKGREGSEGNEETIEDAGGAPRERGAELGAAESWASERARRARSTSCSEVRPGARQGVVFMQMNEREIEEEHVCA
jgi:hypothetical protein